MIRSELKRQKIQSAVLETVLIVEDDESVRSLMARVFRQHGYTVLSAENGEEALRIVEEYPGPLDLMMTDVVMPKVGGRELVQRLGEVRPDTRVIFLSGYTAGTIDVEGLSELATAFIDKPIKPTRLLQTVREVLDG